MAVKMSRNSYTLRMLIKEKCDAFPQKTETSFIDRAVLGERPLAGNQNRR
jgi:hypothetical protein